MNIHEVKKIIEAALMVFGKPLTIANLQKLFAEDHKPDNKTIKNILEEISDYYQNSGIELREVASGYQFQARAELSQYLSKLWEEKPPKYSKALLETLAIISYRQPITRAEIEDIRGVATSSNVIKTLAEREWIKIMGYKDTPGKPALYGTTKEFLDHFNLKNLQELPTLQEIRDLEIQENKLQVELELGKTEGNNFNSEIIETSDENNFIDEISELSEE